MTIAELPDGTVAVPSGDGRRQSIAAVRQYDMRLIEDLGALPGAAASFRGTIGGNSVLELVTADGITGIAPGIDRAALDFVRETLVGRPLFPIASTMKLLEAQGGGSLGRNGASVEIALWDIFGKVLGEPLYRLWGGSASRILAYASTIGRGESVDERVELAVRIAGEGWAAIKLRPHWPTIAEDVALVERVRRATSEDFIILCDANQARGKNLAGVVWDLERAAAIADAYAALGVGWLEEPLARFDYQALSELAARSSVPLAGGENNVALADFRNYALQGCYRFWQPEVMLVGPTAMFRIAALAQAFDIRFVPHEGYQSLGTVCQMHVAAALGAPFVEVLHNPPITTYANYMICYENPPQLTPDGHIELSDAPGLGVALRRDLIEVEY
jgi:L-alanine-DL-glutamate epimerase-like enolase superfamily enzyme